MEARVQEMSARGVAGVYQAPGVHWVGDGFRVQGYGSAIPDYARLMSPFVLLDYHPEFDYTPTTHRRGVGVHPHRGFETVTIVWKGSVAHHDSAGGGGVIGPGDVQWMTAASGILHKEYHEEAYGQRGGPFHVAQLWVNLPREHKMSAPRYQPLTAGEMGRVTLPGDAGEVRVIAGAYGGVSGPAKTFSPVLLWDAALHDGAHLPLSVPAHFNLSLLVMSGAVRIDGQRFETGSLVIFDHAGTDVQIEAIGEVGLLIMGGEPIHEPIVQYGPFVMNTKAEIMQAITDFQSGKFGYLAD